jgi:beta-lactamase regulating signal transducer with metallopeptidase domain
MSVLIGIALKSLFIAGLTLGLLQVLKARSSAERSWVAHIGLLALIIMAFAPLVLPSWNVAVPAVFDSASRAAFVQPAPPTIAVTTPVAARPTVVAAAPRPSISVSAAATAAYAVPAAILLFITFLALARLIALRARAEVLVDGHWLSALARAQRRMGFKHGTALLTSDDLASPISWGLMRPVILLNTRAVEAAGEAEAIIAHELAHVARMDWAKLLLARVATALFWFNPLVWILAREAHQLREEAADDSVLAADIDDTDYAQLLVGVARHESPGLLLGAHGVAPSKGSLARRVARVLDGKTVRGPVARSFAAGVFVGAVAVAAPLAALTLTPRTPEPAKKASPAGIAAAAPVDPSKPYYSPSEVPTDLPSIIAQGVRTAVTAAVSGQSSAEEARQDALDRAADARETAIEAAQNATEEARDAAKEGLKHGQDGAARQHIALQAMGITPDYVAAMRATAPQFARLQPSEFAGMRTVGVTPQFTRELIGAGFPNISADDIVGARAVGLSGSYIRAMKSAGVRGDLDDFTQLRAMGIDPAFAQRARKGSSGTIDADDLVEQRALGRVVPPAPPRPPRAALPAAAPPNWDPPGSDPGG